MKIKKFYLHKEGSTLIMLLIITSILMILGTSILTISISNYKMKKINSEVKEAFYYTEGALDETIIEINKIVYEAIQEGIKEVNNYENNVANSRNGNENNNGNGNGNGNNNDIDHETNKKNLFEQTYISYINREVKTSRLKSFFNNKNRIFNENIDIEVIKNEDLNYSFIVRYSYKYEKIISRDIEISVPKYDDNSNYSKLIKTSNFKIIR